MDRNIDVSQLLDEYRAHISALTDELLMLRAMLKAQEAKSDDPEA